MNDYGTVIEFIRDPQLIGGDLSPWQETALRLFYGLPLNEEQQAIARKPWGVMTCHSGNTVKQPTSAGDAEERLSASRLISRFMKRPRADMSGI